MSGRCADRAGFTLVEVLVAFSILVVIAAGSLTALRATAVAVERGEVRSSESVRLAACVSVLERVLRSASPVAFPAGRDKAPFFDGRRDSLRFLSVPPSLSADPGLSLLSLSIGEARGRQGLLLSKSPLGTSASPWDWKEGDARARVLLRDAKDLTLSYSKGPDAEGKWEWEEEWDASEREGLLPSAVRVSFTVERDGRLAETSLVFPVMAGVRR